MGYVCPLCGRTYRTRSYLRMHIMNHHSSYCPICHRYISTYTHYLILRDRRHLEVARIISREMKLPCPMDKRYSPSEIREVIRRFAGDGAALAAVEPVPGVQRQTLTLDIDTAEQLLRLSEALGINPCTVLRKAVALISRWGDGSYYAGRRHGET